MIHTALYRRPSAGHVPGRAFAFRTGNEEFRPAVNIINRDDRFEIALIAPGFSKEDFSVGLEKNVLKIEGKFTASGDENWFRREYKPANFTRSFEIPATVDAERIEAAYESGILNIVLHKKEEALPKPPISISVS